MRLARDRCTLQGLDRLLFGSLRARSGSESHVPSDEWMSRHWRGLRIGRLLLLARLCIDGQSIADVRRLPDLRTGWRRLHAQRGLLRQSLHERNVHGDERRLSTRRRDLRREPRLLRACVRNRRRWTTTLRASPRVPRRR